jgi:hypothetical protein
MKGFLECLAGRALADGHNADKPAIVRFARLKETALQSALLSTLTLLVHHDRTLPPVLLMAVGTTFIKAVVIPWMLRGST